MCVTPIKRYAFFMDFRIESITKKDIPAIIKLMTEFAEYEKLSEFIEVEEPNLQEAMFGKSAFVEGLMALRDAEPVGYAIFYPCFSTFRGQRGMFLEDLFVSAQCRGSGLGERMLREVARIAAARGFERIDFHVLEWNRSAIGFYEKLGAVCSTEEACFKFTDDAFRRLAGGLPEGERVRDEG